MQTLEEVPKESKGLAKFAAGIKMGVSNEMRLPSKEESKSRNQTEESKSRNQPEEIKTPHQKGWSCL